METELPLPPRLVGVAAGAEVVVGVAVVAAVRPCGRRCRRRTALPPSLPSKRSSPTRPSFQRWCLSPCLPLSLRHCRSTEADGVVVTALVVTAAPTATATPALGLGVSGLVTARHVVGSEQCRHRHRLLRHRHEHRQPPQRRVAHHRQQRHGRRRRTLAACPTRTVTPRASGRGRVQWRRPIRGPPWTPAPTCTQSCFDTSCSMVRTGDCALLFLCSNRESAPPVRCPDLLRVCCVSVRELRPGHLLLCGL